VALRPDGPPKTASLIVAFGLIVQGYAVWKLAALSTGASSGRSWWARRFGVPLGVAR